LSHSVSPHWLLFEIESHLMSGPDWIMILLFVLPLIVGTTGACHCPQPLVEMGVSRTFCLGWPWTAKSLGL
jgi:hypothetical protein